MQKCLDNYNTTFASFIAMLDYHQTQSINSHWVRCPVKELSVESLDKMSPNHMNPSVFALGVGEEAISDTTEHLGLALKVNGELYPVRETAYKTLLDRAKIGGSILPKLSRETLARVLNECLHLSNGDCFVATAKIYPSYKAGENEFLAEATASRAPAADKPSVSAREWAQTAAIGVALRNAGFGLQFSVAGEDFSELAPDELGSLKPAPTADTTFVPVVVKEEEKTTAVVTEMPKRELTLEERYQEAIGLVCPLTKFAGRTLGDVANVEGYI